MCSQLDGSDGNGAEHAMRHKIEPGPSTLGSVFCPCGQLCTPCVRGRWTRLLPRPDRDALNSPPLPSPRWCSRAGEPPGLLVCTHAQRPCRRGSSKNKNKQHNEHSAQRAQATRHTRRIRAYRVRCAPARARCGQRAHLCESASAVMRRAPPGSRAADHGPGQGPPPRGRARRARPRATPLPPPPPRGMRGTPRPPDR